MKRDFTLLTKAEETQLCLSCRLAVCIGPAEKQCPARIADRRKRSAYRVAIERKQRQMRAEGRGYWPEVHGKI